MLERSPVSATVPDWSRETPRGWWDPGRRLIRSIRRYQACAASASPFTRAVRRYWVLQHWFWSIVTSCEIPLCTEIGGGLLLTHPNGIVIHPDARLGPNCLVFQQVTIGVGKGGVPTIGGHVDIAAGAKLVGKIVVADHALIGLNAVVMRDVPRGGVAVGAPARIARIREFAEDDIVG